MKRFHHVGAAALGAVLIGGGADGTASALQPMSSQGTITATLPIGPGGANVTVTARFGARLDVTGPAGDQSMPIAAGWHITSPTPLPEGCRLEVLNVITQDTAPGRYRDAGGQLHIVNDLPRLDPLPGGNIPPNGSDPTPPADRDPWFDGTTRNAPANALTGPGNYFDLLPANLNLGAEFNPPTTNLDIAFGDLPTAQAGVSFLTLLVIVCNNTEVGVIGGFGWRNDSEGLVTIDSAPFNGLGTLGAAALQGAFNRSGYAGFHIIPSPSSSVLAAAGIGVLMRRHRRGPD